MTKKNTTASDTAPAEAEQAAAPATGTGGTAIALPPKPGDADYDWSAHYDTNDLYRHTFADGTVVALKKFGAIYSKTWLYKLRGLVTDVDVEFAALDRGACETAKELLMSLDDSDGDPISDLFAAWVDAGTRHDDAGKGLTPGE